MLKWRHSLLTLKAHSFWQSSTFFLFFFQWHTLRVCHFHLFQKISDETETVRSVQCHAALGSHLIVTAQTFCPLEIFSKSLHIFSVFHHLMISNTLAASKTHNTCRIFKKAMQTAGVNTHAGCDVEEWHWLSSWILKRWSLVKIMYCFVNMWYILIRSV